MPKTVSEILCRGSNHKFTNFEYLTDLIELCSLVSIFPGSKGNFFYNIANRPPQMVVPIFGQMLKTHFSR